MNDDEINDTLLTAYKLSPPVIQGFITSGALQKFVDNVQKKYGLHVDLAGRLSDEMLMMLLGITQPDEIVQTLTEQVLIRQDQLKNVLDDMNDQVFEPLRQAEKQGTPVPPPGRSTPLPAPALGTEAPPAPPVSSPTPATPAAATLPAPAVRPVVMPTPSQPPATLPGTMPATRIPSAPPVPVAAPKPPASVVPPPPSEPNKNREELHDVLKSYGIDPYREAAE